MANDTVVSVSWGFMIASVGMGIFFYIPLFADTLTESKAAIGSLFSLTAVITVLMQPLFGRYSDQKRKRKPFIVSGILFTGVIYLFYPFVGTIFVLLIFRSFQGLTISIYMPITPALIADVTTPSERGQAIGKWNEYSSIGILIGVIACGVITYLTKSFTPTFYFTGLMFVSSALLIQTKVNEPTRNISGKIEANSCD